MTEPSAPHLKKIYIDAQTLLDDALELALLIADKGFKPDLIIGVWRGGTPVAIAIQEAFEFIGCKTDHIAIRTISYKGIAQRGEVEVEGLEYIQKNLEKVNSILLVDDVYDTGLSLQQVMVELNSLSDKNLEIKIATPYFKPKNNQTQRVPDFYLHEVSNWLVFPHELMGLSDTEVLSEKRGNLALKKRLLAARLR